MIPSKARVLLGLMGVTALVFVLGSCGAAEEPTPTMAPVAQPTATATPVPTPTPSEAEPKYGGIANYANWADPPGWDPFITGTINMRNMASPAYGEGNLIRLCREDVFALCPQLAESWESNSDFSVWTFKIRDNVFWHDGTPLTPEDMKWWLELAKNPPEGRGAALSNVAKIEKMEVLGGNRLAITLAGPTIRFPFQLMSSAAYQVAHPRHLMQPEIDKGNVTVAPNEVNWVATGPFKIIEYTKGSVVKVRRFDRYWEKDQKGRQLPFMDGVDYPIIKDTSAMLAAFRSGRLDMTLRWCNQCITPAKEKIIEDAVGKDNVYFVRTPAFIQWLSINSTVPPWDDIRVRQAANLWLDRQALGLALFSGLIAPSGLFPAGTPYVNPDAGEWPGMNSQTKEADRKRAKELLAEAGYANGFETVMMCRTPTFMDWCEALATDLNGLLGEGKVTLDPQDTGAFYSRHRKGDWVIVYGSATPGDPEAMLSGFKTRTDTDAGGWLSQHTDLKVNEFFDKLANMPDGQERFKLAQELERYTVKDQVYSAPLWIYKEDRAYRSHVKGVIVPVIGVHFNIDVATEWLDK